MGWNASDTRPLAFDDCRVPEENLARRARRTASGSSSRRSTAAASASPRWGSGLAQGALDEALAYAKERRAFGRPISSFQAIQIEARRHVDRDRGGAASHLPRGARSRTPAATFSLAAAQAKLKTGRLAVRACEEAVQIHGGYGYIEEYPVCRFYRDAKILDDR